MLDFMALLTVGRRPFKPCRAQRAFRQGRPVALAAIHRHMLPTQREVGVALMIKAFPGFRPSFRSLVAACAWACKLAAVRILVAISTGRGEMPEFGGGQGAARLGRPVALDAIDRGVLFHQRVFRVSIMPKLLPCDRPAHGGLVAALTIPGELPLVRIPVAIGTVRLQSPEWGKPEMIPRPNRHVTFFTGHLRVLFSQAEARVPVVLKLEARLRPTLRGMAGLTIPGELHAMRFLVAIRAARGKAFEHSAAE